MNTKNGTLENEEYVVGLKQTLRALENDKAKKILIGRDADKKMLTRAKEMAMKHSVKIELIDTMELLGNMAGLKVGAVSIALLKPENN
ncbi:MAG: ribosomal L7Ae/L30e/S12e/Gadd45 family protein [Clostridia bacterium]|nr:ribosomal L7Ae/L30e/S12e/Gadd45 family protein [Clostridia bacterium]